MSFGLDHLKDPLTSGNLLTSLLPLITQFMDRRAQQNDPNTLGFVNNLIGDYNASNAYNPSTGQFQAGNPYGDAASGYGGAFGSDSRGNPLSASGAFTQYALSQIQGGQGNLDQRQASLANLASSAGGNVAAPGGYQLNTPSGLNPGAVQGVDQSVRRPPTPLQELQPQEDFISRAQDRMGPGGGGLFGLGVADRLRGLVGSYAVGTTSVPRTGLAEVHQGEMIVPAGQNPNRLPPGQPGQPLQTPYGGGAMAPPKPPSVPVNNMGPTPQMGPPQQQMAPPAPTPQMGPPTGQAPVMPPSPAGGGYGALQPGLSPEVQQQIINRSVDANNRESEALKAQLSTDAALRGQTGGGLERRLFEAELARSGQNANITQDVGIEAASRQFADQLAANNFYLNRDLGLGQLGLGQGQLALQGDLGRRQLALDELLGQGQLDLQGGRLDLDRDLGMGQLGIQQGQLANDTFLAQLQERLGQGQLDLQGGRLDLDRQLGLGQLGVQQGQLGIQQGELDLNRLLGEGQLGLQRDQLGLQRDQFGLDRQLGLGQLGIQQGELDLNRLLGEGQLGLQRDQFGLDRQLGLGQLGIQQGELDLNRLLGEGQLGIQQGELDLNRLLGEGQLGLQRDQFGLDQELGRGALDLDRLLGEGQLGIQQGNLDLNRLLGQGGLDFQNRSFDAEYGRSLNNDLFDQYRYEQDNANTQFQNLLQQQYMGDQQNQFSQLLGLLSQYSGQAGTSAAPGSSGTTTSSGGGGGLVAGGLQQRIGDSLRNLFGLAA